MSEVNRSENIPNRRSTPRAALDYRLTIETDDYKFDAKTINLSFGGALIETGGALPADKPFIVQLMNKNDACTSYARVVRRSESRLAISFVEPSENFLNVLIEVMSPHLPVDTWERLE